MSSSLSVEQAQVATTPSGAFTAGHPLPFSYPLYDALARRKFVEVMGKECLKFVIAGRGWSERRYVLERMGWLGRVRKQAVTSDRPLWIHANSLGEVYAASFLIQGLRSRDPSCRIWLSSGNLSADAVARTLSGLERVVFCPFDVPGITRRVLSKVQPFLLVIVEAGIRPNLVRSCQAMGIPVVVVSGRLAPEIPLYNYTFTQSSEVLHHVDRFCLQSESEAEQVLRYLPDASRVRVTGNLKFGRYQMPDGEDVARRLRDYLRVRPEERWLVVGSLHRGEEDAVFDAFAALRARYSATALVIAPRYLEIVPLLEAEAMRRGYRVARRTALDHIRRRDQEVVILDTYGELPYLYAVATWVVLGNSLIPGGGGQNMIEPAWYAKPILLGASVANFQAEVALFLSAEAAVQVQGPEQLTSQLVALAEDPERAAGMGRRARALVDRYATVVDETLEAIAEYLDKPLDNSLKRLI